MAQTMTYQGVELSAPDPLPYDSGSPDTASFVPGWYNVVASSLGRQLTNQEKVDLSKEALALYGYDSKASITLTDADTTLATSGQTITGGDYSVLEEIHANAEVVSQDRIDQGISLASSAVSVVKDGAVAVGEWAGEVIAAPLRGFASGVFNTRTVLTFAGVAAAGLGGLYFVSRITHPGVTVGRAKSKGKK